MLVSMVHGDGARPHGAFDPEKARIASTRWRTNGTRRM